MASQYADEIVAFKDGQVFLQGTTAQIMQADLLSQLYEIPITLADINGKRSVSIANYSELMLENPLSLSKQAYLRDPYIVITF